jgi:hypothetical protein
VPKHDGFRFICWVTGLLSQGPFCAAPNRRPALIYAGLSAGTLLCVAKVVSGDCPSFRVGDFDLAIAKAADAEPAAQRSQALSDPFGVALGGFGIRKFDRFRIECLAFLGYVNVIHGHGA